MRPASSRADSPRRPADWFGRIVLARGELSRSPDESGVDVGGSLLLVERRHVSPECAPGTWTRLAGPGSICVAHPKARLAPDVVRVHKFVHHSLVGQLVHRASPSGLSSCPVFKAWSTPRL